MKNSTQRWTRDKVKLNEEFYKEKEKNKEEVIEVKDINQSKIINNNFQAIDLNDLSNKISNLVIEKVNQQLSKQKVRSFDIGKGNVCLLNNNYLHLAIDVRKYKEDDRIYLFEKIIPNKFSEQEIYFSCKSKTERETERVGIQFDYDPELFSYYIVIPKLLDETVKIEVGTELAMD